MELLENKSRMHFSSKECASYFIGIMFFLLFDEFRGPVLFFRRLLKSVACSGEDFLYAVYRLATELGGTLTTVCFWLC